MPHSARSTPDTTDANIPDEEQELSQRYWNANQAKESWTKECPEFLVGTSEKNKGILSRKDEEFRRRSWEEVKELVKSFMRGVLGVFGRRAEGVLGDLGTNRIDQFQRSASQLRGYLEYTHRLKKKHGSVLEYVQRYRLDWDSITPSAGDKPFGDPGDWKVLYNDWPYFVDEEITHLVVWTKFLIDEDETTGEVREDGKSDIEEFIETMFCGDGRMGMERDRIVWFKNWKSLKSVHALGKWCPLSPVCVYV
ncbi:hypothetical protein LTR96_005900 [Exophiala xenobiotica]|uniref:Uncharacterized protein n=1 Tax=Vermiconidia calcicola TaxID=1690605 RepID=A0AAV9PZR1_9PEZI|nr:hypothetical protein LTR96_005900 [Exophiala xenobiotica]KAK5337457.1 hypothetical protein LTR98_006572 [Exophiala xenobiotica]KAK5451041.1 hypothetical protein LTR18_001057 [Exophiala xenobiotica]KAK5531000.1 hypothetical protein LTR25_008857 [Vermiconidia calcicola]KAK5544492.1 hypothetical protein LTR23_004580 [Chaetothyriales sp. CCFEE 6169]